MMSATRQRMEKMRRYHERNESPATHDHPLCLVDYPQSVRPMVNTMRTLGRQLADAGRAVQSQSQISGAGR